MATVEMYAGQDVAKRITAGMMLPLKRTKLFFQGLGTKFFQQTMITFRTEGARAGHKKWLSLNMGRGPGFFDTVKGSSTRTSLGTWKIRYGTDKKPKRNAEALKKYKTDNNLWYVPGPMKGYRSQRRYGPNSKPLQAGGMFRNSFKVIKTTNRFVKFGSMLNKQLVKNIQSNPTREVLFVEPQDYKTYRLIWRTFLDKHIKFK